MIVTPLWANEPIARQLRARLLELPAAAREQVTVALTVIDAQAEPLTRELAPRMLPPPPSPTTTSRA